MKKLLAFITIASLTLGTAAFAFADEVADDANEVEVTEELEEETEVAGENEAETPEEITPVPVVEEIVPVALKYGVKSYTNAEGHVIGTYPDIIAEKAVKAIEDTINANPNLETVVANDASNTFTFEVEELATASKITLNFNYARANGDFTDAILVAYVDNATGEEVSEEVFNALIPAEEVTEEEAPEAEEVVEEEAPEAAEPVLVPVRLHAEALGYTVNWNPEGSVEITDGVRSTTLVLDSKSYTTFEGEVVELDAAPVFVEGTVYVTVEFFSEILGANVIVNESGTIVITGEVVAPVAAEDEAEVEGEVPAEDEAVAENEVPAENEAEVEGEVPAEDETAVE